MTKVLHILLFMAVVLAGCTTQQGRTESAMDFEAKALADSLKDVDELCRWVHHYDSIGETRASMIMRQKYGSALRDHSNFDAAIAQHDSCISIARELQDTLQLIIALNNQGTNFRRLGDMHEASNYHYEALGLCDLTTNDTSFIARKNVVRTLNGLGNVLMTLKNNEAAEDLFRRALAGEEALGSPTGQAINLANIGSIKEAKGELDSARIYYIRSMAKNTEVDNRVGISLCHQYLGHLDEQAGDVESALDNYRKGYEVGTTTFDVWHWIEPCEALANLYIEENKLDSARKYTQIAYDAALQINSLEQQADAHALSARLYEKMGDYAKAMQETHQYQACNESIDVAGNASHLQNLRVKYEATKRSEALRAAEAKAEYEKTISTILIWSFVVVGLLIAITIGSRYRVWKERQRTNEILRKVDEERQEFYRGITHQLRTPLTVVLGMTEQLKSYLPQEDEMVHRKFDAVTRRTQDLLNLVTEMIEYNKGIRKDIKISELTIGDPKAPLVTDVPSQHAGDVPIQSSPNEMLAAKESDYILVAEDDPDVALLITEMLKNEGYDFAWAHDGMEAFEKMKMNIPKLLITDIMMPNMDGLQLMKVVRAEETLNHIPVIVVSARVDNADRLAGIEAGAEVYLGKPFVPDELLLLVRKMLEQRALLQEKFSKQIKEADAKVEKELMEGKDLRESDKEFLRQVDDSINKNIMNGDFNAGILADELLVTTTTLNRRIKAITNTDTTHYIRLRRLGRAKQLLLTTDMSMGEIQAVCGFESPSYFSRAFKAEIGCSPSEFKKNTLENA